MQITLFLGAGASVPFDKPTTKELKDILLKKDFKGGFNEYLLKSLLQVPNFDDIEYVLQSIKDIVDFSSSRGNDYFSSLGYNANFRHQMLTYNSSGYSFEQVVDELKNVYATLKAEVFENYSWKTNEDNNLIAINDVLISFLQKESDQIRIFTTNYDQAIERYCEIKNDLRLVDGFKYDVNRQKNIWAEGDYTYYDKMNDNIKNIYLYKLHGSLNWKEHTTKWLERTSEETLASDPKYPNNIVIYPTLSPKEGLETEPYKSIFDNFKKVMKSSDYCIVIGFSFRDRLSKVFEDFIEDGKTIISFSPSAIEDYHVHMLHQKPTKEKLESWKGTPGYKFSNLGSNKTGAVYLIRKKLEVNTVEEIIHDINKIIFEPA